MTPTSGQALTWAIAAVATAGVIARPFNWPEAVWALLGAILLVGAGLLPVATAWTGVAKGLDVYLFLAGMMLLSEIARHEGLFDWVAAHAASHANGSPRRLFLLVYGVGTVVTVLLSNDATAVVLTPAVYAATRAAKIERPLPYLLICAFIANAASFVLPISNPANLVVFGGGRMPALAPWLKMFLAPSAAAILVTYAALRFCVRDDLRGSISTPLETPRLSGLGATAAAGIALTCVGLIGASALGFDLGLPTFVAGVATTVLVLAVRGKGAPALARELALNISWSVLPLVAGLFVLVEALDRTGVIATIAAALREISRTPDVGAAWSGAGIAVASNFVNNLPAGLVAAGAVQQAASPAQVTGAILIGVDLGPNLSVTGSLATILWLSALRREGQRIGALDFLKIGCIVMPPALIAALATLLAFSR